MKNVSEEEQIVSQAYQTIKLNENNIRPPVSVDAFIQQAAAKATAKSQVKKKSQYFLPLSIAASVLIVAGVVLKLAVISDSGNHGSDVINTKQPMFMLQRSKPASVENMMIQIRQYLDDNKIENARYEYQKLRHYYPDYILNVELEERLK